MSSQLLRLFFKWWVGGKPSPLANGIYSTIPLIERQHSSCLTASQMIMGCRLSSQSFTCRRRRWMDGGDITATQKVMSFSSSVILVLYGPNDPAVTLLSWPCRSFERVFPVIVVSTVISITFVSLAEWMDLLPYRLGFIYKINEASSHSTIQSTQKKPSSASPTINSRISMTKDDLPPSWHERAMELKRTSKEVLSLVRIQRNISTVAAILCQLGTIAE